MANDHSNEIRRVQELVVSWNHDKDDDWPVNRSILTALTELLSDLERDDCPYTHAHTRHWCGNPRCRDS